MHQIMLSELKMGFIPNVFLLAVLLFSGLPCADNNFMGDILHEDCLALSNEQRRYYYKYLSDSRLTWSKDELTHQLDFQLGFCSGRCMNGKTVQNSTGCYGIVCNHCECERPFCEILGICCPDYSVPRSSNISLSLDDNFTDQEQETASSKNTNVFHDSQMTTEKIITDLQENEGINAIENSSSGIHLPEAFPYCAEYYDEDESRGVLVVRSCPKSFQNKEKARLCEEDIPIEQKSINNYGLVTDPNTGVVYYNKLCAQCNDVLQAQSWSLDVTCDHLMLVYTAQSQEEFFQRALHPESSCGINQKSPVSYEKKLIPCDVYWQNKLITSCNETGQWKKSYDAVLQACESMVGKWIWIVQNTHGNYFSNVFCALCNLGEEIPSIRSIETFSGGFGPRRGSKLPFTLLLGLHQRDFGLTDSALSGGREELCSEDTWMSPDGNCIPLNCAEGKLLINGSCSTAVEQIKGLSYFLFLWFVPEKDEGVVVLDEFLLPYYYHSVNYRLAKILNHLVIQWNYNTTGAAVHGKYKLGSLNSASEPKSTHQLSHPFAVWVKYYLTATQDLGRDIVEQYFTNISQADFYVEIEDRHVRLVPLFDVAFIDSNFSDVTSNSPDDISQHDDLYYVWPPHFLFLRVTPLLTCKWVEFQSSLYQIVQTFQFPFKGIILNVNGTKVNIFDVTDFNSINITDSGTLRICVELLEKKLMAIVHSRSSAFAESQYFLTLLCSFLSILCLCITAFSYMIFPKLRSVAGKNTMFLSISLLLAQVSLVTSSHVKSPSVLCQIVGICTHYFWLCAFTWGFVSCLHMFRVFTSGARVLYPTPKTQLKYLLKTLLSASIGSALPVIFVIVYSIVDSNGESMGYEKACYLNSSFLVGIAMIAPLVITITCNLIFFVVTVAKIHQVRKLQTHQDFKKDDRKNMYAYVKLSSLTGSFWLIAILAENLDNDPLRFVSIVLNGLQGVFIFFSYVCNRRVWRMYQHKLRLGTATTSSDMSSGQSTLASIRSLLRKGPKGTKAGPDPASKKGEATGQGEEEITSQA